MYDMAITSQEKLRELELELNEIKIFLIGNVSENVERQETKENCFMDTMHNNNTTIDNCLELTTTILDIMKGNGK